MPLTPLQTLFTLSLLPNLGHAFSGSVDTIEGELTGEIQVQLKNLEPQIGPWELVWGPAVFELPASDRPDNIMLVARNGGVAGLPGLVVAVAGTNPYSFLDWLVEDFLVSTQIPWPTGSAAGQAMISLGTFNGLAALQKLKPGPGQPGAGTTVRSFLSTQVRAPVAINVCGHSLGGALSPTLALWLHDTQADWDPAHHASFSVLPSAGPTAGNQAFAAYSDSQIGPQVTRLHNPLDVVPHAWAATDLAAVPGLYLPQIAPDPVVQGFGDLALAISKGCGYAQIDPGAPPLAGAAVDPAEIRWFDPPFVNFFRQAGFQHVDAYSDLLGLGTETLGPMMLRIKTGARLVRPTDILARLKGKLAKSGF
ncbi:MAG: lipase [Acidobacteriota bacterium]|nr:lipase [Acidobacteriota bacterium]